MNQPGLVVPIATLIALVGLGAPAITQAAGDRNAGQLRFRLKNRYRPNMPSLTSGALLNLPYGKGNSSAHQAFGEKH